MNRTDFQDEVTYQTHLKNEIDHLKLERAAKPWREQPSEETLQLEAELRAAQAPPHALIRGIVKKALDQTNL